MKMPNFAWSYHSGSGLESMDFQLGSYLALLAPICRINKSKGKTAKAPISVPHTDPTSLFRRHMTVSKVAELTLAGEKKQGSKNDWFTLKNQVRLISFRLLPAIVQPIISKRAPPCRAALCHRSRALTSPHVHMRSRILLEEAGLF